jgi:hypothetical protein
MGRVFAYIGFRPAYTPKDLKFYAFEVGLRDKTSVASRDFVQIAQGAVFLDEFLSERSNFFYLDQFILRLPSGAYCNYGVLERDSGKENGPLTRAVFGLGLNDLEQLAQAFFDVTHFKRPDWSNSPKITFSKTRDNSCDLTGFWIPRNFPYLSFVDSAYFGGHVSFQAFSQILRFSCGPATAKGQPLRNLMYERMIGAGVDHDCLNYVLSQHSLDQQPVTFAEVYGQKV